ncbi:DUF5666 domain-containing protein [Myxococcota bacterium]|nr:DUF5666 domain-containing protein [Myxococcota bacterium]
MTNAKHIGGALLMMITTVIASSATAQMPEEISAGTRVEVEGRIFDMQTILAVEMAVLRAPSGEDSIKGIIQEVDHQKKTMTVAGVRVDCSGDCFVAGGEGRPLDYQKIEPGKRAKAKGVFKNDVFVGDYIQVKEMKPGASADADLEGKIGSVDRAANSFLVNGVAVQVTPKTIIEME